MFRLYIYSFLLVTCYSCQKNNQIEYSWIRKNGNSCDTISVSKIVKSIFVNTVRYDYITNVYRLSYFIDSSKDSSFFTMYPKSFLHKDDSLVFMRNILDTSIEIKGKQYHIQKFIVDEHVIDAATFHYYESTLGIYAIESASWPIIQYLHSTDTLLNRNILSLIKTTIPDFVTTK
jgi:hypothetical protein